MIRKTIIAVAALAGAAIASAALAEEFVDYTPEKGIWEINAIEVDPNHVDDYLVGLRSSQLPGFEVMQKHGLMDAYKFVVRTGYTKGSPNVLIMTHLTSPAVLVPDKTRDMMIEKEIFATFSKDQGKAAIAGYEKYRSFLDDSMWTEMTFAK